VGGPVAVLIFAAVVGLAVPAIAWAAEPILTATVIPGQEIDIMGSVFPADADVLLEIQRNGADAGSQTLRTDALGTFTATVDAGPGRGGNYTFVATSDSARAEAGALAVETAGGTGGLKPSPPPTDAVASPSGTGVHGGWTILVAMAVGLFIGCSLARRGARPTTIRQG
jgi:hypothetical protein